MAGTADKILEHLLETRIGKECDSTGIYSNKMRVYYAQAKPRV